MPALLAVDPLGPREALRPNAARDDPLWVLKFLTVGVAEVKVTGLPDPRQRMFGGLLWPEHERRLPPVSLVGSQSRSITFPKGWRGGLSQYRPPKTPSRGTTQADHDVTLGFSAPMAP